jgi:TolA-binding protein
MKAKKIKLTFLIIFMLYGTSLAWGEFYLPFTPVHGMDRDSVLDQVVKNDQAIARKIQQMEKEIWQLREEIKTLKEHL